MKLRDIIRSLFTSERPTFSSDIPEIAKPPAKAGGSAPDPHAHPEGEFGEDTVRRAAFLRYLDRVERGEPGDSVSDWVEAERQLAAESSEDGS